MKRLFALSGNVCAFPDCTHPVIDRAGNVVAQICHIEAAEGGGERYNKDQSDDDRAAFENLLLLCYPHHVATNDVAKYPAEALRDMKAAHEAKHRESPATATDEIAEKLLAAYEQTAMNLGSGIQNVVQNGSINFVHRAGLSYTDVRDIVDDRIRQHIPNLPTLTDAANQKVRENLTDFGRKLVDEFSARKVTPEQAQRLAEPDTQYTLQQATIGGARSSDEAVRQLLAGLVIERLKSDHDLASIAFSEAVSVLPKLTKMQLRILAMASFVTQISFRGIADWQAFNVALHQWADLLPVTCSHNDVRHLTSVGAAFADALEVNIRSVWSKAYPTLFRDVTDDEIRRVSPLAASFMAGYTTPLNTVKVAPIGMAITLVYLQQFGLNVPAEIWFPKA